MNNQSNPIDLPKLKSLIHQGFQAIPVDKETSQAVIVIGDTGVGKSTIMSFLAGNDLVIRCDGLKPCLDNASDSSKIRIGHQKYSQTSVPTKVIIEGMAFYDSPGFRDNKGEEYQISNSFFVQRLLDIYLHVKIVLIVDESHISEARADKFPKLLKNLHRSFKTFEDIKNGICVIINRAASDHKIDDYNKEIQKIAELKNQNESLFAEKQQEFLKFLVNEKRILLFKQVEKGSNEKFEPKTDQNSIMEHIKAMQFVSSKHIENILSQSAKLAIRDFIDDITLQSNLKIQSICAQIVEVYTKKAQKLGRDTNGIISLKDQIIKLAEEIKCCNKQQIPDILQRELTKQKIQDFDEDFASIMFFKGIYDKTVTYFSNLTNKIYSQLSHLLTRLDKRITIIQAQDQEEVKRQIEFKQMKQKQAQRQQQKMLAKQHCEKMEVLKIKAQNIIKTRETYLQQIKAALQSLASIQEQLKMVKVEALNLRNFTKDISNDLEKINLNQSKSRMK